MELKELTSAEQVVMKCIWDYGKGYAITATD